MGVRRDPFLHQCELHQIVRYAARWLVAAIFPVGILMAGLTITLADQANTQHAETSTLVSGRAAEQEKFVESGAREPSAAERAKGVEADTQESSCFVIGSDDPPAEGQKLVIARQVVCPFVRIPSVRK